MSLVFRTDQTTPLTNDQVDNNFKYLRDQILLKYNVSDFTAANISSALRTQAQGQSSYALSQSNALNAWKVRDLEPFSGMPVTTAKDSLVARNTAGDIYVGSVYGSLIGNATTATTATTAGKLTNSIQINGVSFDGSSSITIADNTKLPLAGGTMTGKLNLVNLAYHYAPINLGAAIPDDNAKVNGDVWVTSTGLFFYVGNTTYQSAPLSSPTFVGSVKAPGYDGTSDQVITLSHLSNATTTINGTLALKAPLSSPSFSGAPTSPTPAVGTNTTQIATTAFVKTAVDNKGADTLTSANSYTDTSIINLSNSVNTLLAAKATLASPSLTGTPTAPTAATGNNSTQIATTAFTTNSIAVVQSALNSAVAALQDAINSTRPVPVASVFYIAASTVPYGYLEANGQAVSNTTYSALWIALGSPLTTNGDAIGTFRVPDLRGEFIRGWDHTRGVDNGRTLLSLQYSQNLQHNHGMPGDDQLSFADGQGGWSSSSRGTFPYDAHSNYGGGGQIWNTTTDGGGEARPRNIALMPIIKW